MLTQKPCPLMKTLLYTQPVLMESQKLLHTGYPLITVKLINSLYPVEFCFIHESVLRRQNFVTKKIISSALKIKRGELDVLKVGNTSILRDWGYAPEYIKAMWQMLNVDKPGDYAICSGKAHTLQHFIDTVFVQLGLDPQEYVELDKNLYRPVELKIIFGNSNKAKQELGWQYNISFDQLIQKLIRR